MVVEDDTHVIYGPKPHEPLPKECLGQLLINSLMENPIEEIMICGHTGETISYKQILQEACNLAEALQKYGCNEDSFIAIASENHLKYFVPTIASFIIGSVLVPINPIYSTDELMHVMNLTNPKVVFCSQLTVHNFLESRDDFKSLEKIILLDPLEIPDVENMENFIKTRIGERPVDIERCKVFNGNPSEHVAVILMSSGTTGLPKGVMLTDQNMEIRMLQGRDPVYVSNIRADAVAMGLLPFFHGYGIVTALTCILTTKKLVMMKMFDEDLFLRIIQDYKMTFLVLAPPLVVFLAKSPKVDKYDLSSVTQVGCGAAPLKKETELSLKNRLKNIHSIRQGYGLTECLAATLAEEGIKDKDGTVGRTATYSMLKIRDPETGRSLGPNQVGEICIKSPQVMKGYYKNEAATKESFTSDGWLRSGDLGYYDKDHFIYIVDRLKELIKYKAFQVAPAELEALLLNHPKILDAGVVGLPDEVAGELPVAFVAKKPEVEVTEKEIQDFIAGKVSAHKKLRGGVIFIPEIPKSAAGKILRRELRTMLAEHRAHQESKL